MGFEIAGPGGVSATTTTAGALNVTLPATLTAAGYNRPVSELDAGLVTGTARLLAGEVSEDYRIRSELDTVLAYDEFNYVLQDTGKYVFRNTTMTGSWASGAFSTNASGITTTTTGCQLLTRQYFPVFGGAETYAYFKMAFTGTWGATNTTIDIGLMTGATTTPYAPTDGVFFRATSAGLFGVSSVNGVEQPSSAFISAYGGAAFTPTIGTFYDCIVSCGENAAVFWMDLRNGNGYVVMARIATAVGSSRPLYAGSLQFGVRQAHVGAASVVQGVKVSAWTVSQGGYHTSKPWLEQMNTAGMSGAQGQQGGTMGSTALLTNSLALGAGLAMTNTTAALGVGLGGQFTALPTLAVPTDGIVCSYLNPIPTTGITGRVLIIDSIKISTFVAVALTGGPVVYVVGAAWGHDNATPTLAAAEGAASKAPRRKVLGVNQFAAAAAIFASGGADIVLNNITDIAVNPGEYFAITAKNVGTVTTLGAVTFLVSIQSHWAS